MLTKLKDTDLKILEELDDKDLLTFCLLNKSASELCSYEPFWRNRLSKKYPDAVKYYQDTSLIDKSFTLYPELSTYYKPVYTWKKYYFQTVYYVNKMREDFGFIYKTGDPKNYYLILFGVEYPHVQIELAAKMGYIDLLEYLLSKGSFYSLNIYNLFSGAAQENQLGVINHFWKDGADSIQNANAGLLGAVLGGNLNLVKFFINKGANDISSITIAELTRNNEILKYLKDNLA